MVLREHRAYLHPLGVQRAMPAGCGEGPGKVGEHSHKRKRGKMSDLIPFNAWSQERIQIGQKICTSRHKRYSKDPRVTCIVRLPWWMIRNYLWEPEGAKDMAELQEVIEDIYKRVVTDDEMFYVHFGNYKKDVEGRA